jgi:Cell division protein
MKSKFSLIGLIFIFLLSLGACKSKESAYKAAYEKAKEREMNEGNNEEIEEVVPVSKPKQTVTTEPVAFQKEKVTAVDEIDTNRLRRYNVVVGSFINKTNATSLKERMERDGYNVILAQNERQMYRVIVASYDDRNSARKERNDIKTKYYPDFQDAWLLEQDY